MVVRCAACRRHLQIATDSSPILYQCPYCKITFELSDGCTRSKEASPASPSDLAATNHLFLAIDVSTSVARYLGTIHRALTHCLNTLQESEALQLRVYLFNRDVVRFPDESPSGADYSDSDIIPTLDDLRQRVGAGTAILDVLYRMLSDASKTIAPRRDVIVFTDGWERSSRRHVEEVRHQIAAIRSSINVCLIGFVDTRTHDRLAHLAGQLGLSENSWSLTLHDGRNASVEESIVRGSLEVVRFATAPPRFW